MISIYFPLITGACVCVQGCAYVSVCASVSLEVNAKGFANKHAAHADTKKSHQTVHGIKAQKEKEI